MDQAPRDAGAGMTRVVPAPRSKDERDLRLLKARCAGHSLRSIAEEEGVAHTTVADTTASIRKSDLQAINSKKMPLKGKRLRAELDDHSAKYWPQQTGALGSK